MNWIDIILGPLTVKILNWLTKTPAQADAKAAAFGDFDIPRANWGDPGTLMWGTVRNKSPQTLWAGDYKPQAIKKKQSTGLFSSKKVIVGYHYYMGLDYLLGIGQGYILKKIWANDQVIWTGSQSVQGDIHINLPNAFGGDDQQGGLSGTITFYPGDLAPAQDPYLQQVVSPNVPAYNGWCRVVFKNFYVGTTSQLPTFSFELTRLPQGMSNTLSTMPNGLDMNVFAIIYDVLTQPYARFGNDPALIDMTSWLAAAQTIYNEGLNASFQIQNASTGKDILTAVMDLADGVIYQEPSTRKMVAKLIRNDYDPATLPVFDESVINDMASFTKTTWDGTYNQCRVTFSDRANQYDDSVAVAQDFANINMQQRVVTTNVTTNVVAESTTALKMASSQLSRGNVPLYTCEITCNRKAAAMRPGGCFIMNYSPFGLTGMVMRAGKVDLGQLEKGVVKITCTQDRYALNTPVFAPPPTTGWTPPDTSAKPVINRKVLELPYFFANPSVPPAVGQTVIGALASPPAQQSTDFSADITTNADTTFANASTDLADAPYYGSGLLSALYPASAGRTTGLDATGFKVGGMDNTALATGTYVNDGTMLLSVDDELMGYTTFTNNGDGTFTFAGIYRALLDTDFADHAAGARVFVVSDIDGVFINYYADTAAYRVRLIDHTPASTLDSSLAMVDTLTMTQRVYRPAPPDYVQLNGSRTPASAFTSAAIAVTWRERNRLTQTTTLYNAASETQEAGVDYGVRYRLGTGAWTAYVYSSGTSATIPAPGNSYAGAVEVQVVSRRNGVLSRVGDSCFITLTIETFNLTTQAGEALTNVGGDHLRTL